MAGGGGGVARLRRLCKREYASGSRGGSLKLGLGFRSLRARV